MPFEKRTVTPKRRAANCAAAQKSTGPQTPKGKQRSALNSLKHGAFASQQHLLDEALARSGCDPVQMEDLRQSLLNDWRPSGSAAWERT
ncbi:MAG: hypothetical protein ACRD3D_11080 [Terriglobia bacterium]